MNRLLWLTVTASLAGPCLAARSNAPLPTWNEADRKVMEKSGWLAGGQILGGGAEADAPQPAPVHPPDLGQPTAADLAADQVPASPVPEKYLTAYFDARPKTFLIDPQGLLDRQCSHDQLAFLTAHAADSPIDLFIYVFAKDQEIPGEVRGEELSERCFASGRPALLAYYFLGAPQHARLYLSPSLPDVISPGEQRRALQSSITKATEKSGQQKQLQAFTDELARRIYRMEQLLHGISNDADDAKAAQTRAAKLAKKSSSMAERWARWRPLAEDLAIPGLLLGSLLAASLGMIGWRRWRATYRFPEIAVEPRLGGDHAAGVGAVISFASADLPPASQRNQVAHFVRRT